VEHKLRCIREAAQARFDQIELNLTVRDVRVSDNRRAAARDLLNEWASRPQLLANVSELDEDEVLDSPYIAVGSVEQIVEQFEMTRERWGFTYLEISSPDAEAIAPVMQRLNGR
jgi:hypothetical protein